MHCVGMVSPQQRAVLCGKSIHGPSDILGTGTVKLQGLTRQPGVSLISPLIPWLRSSTSDEEGL